MLSGEPKSAVERPGDAREETGWQTLMVLQHVDILRETSEFRFHGCLHTRSRTLRQYQAEGRECRFYRHEMPVFYAKCLEIPCIAG